MQAKRSRWLGYLRLALLYALVAGLVWTSRPTPPTFFLGLALVLPGGAIRLWASGHLLKSTELVTSGPYAYTQNPLYLGRLLLFVGFSIMARLPYLLNLAVLALGLAVFFLYYIPRKVRVEGRRLAERHGGAWAAYHQAMPILFPRLSRYPAAGSARWRVGRMLRNREHWMVIGVSLVCLLFGLKALRGL